MGIKENFSQAVRELAGGGKDESRRDKSIDGMRNAVAAEDTSEFAPIGNMGAEKQEPEDSFDEIEKRAAAAAEEYSRRQSAFSETSFESTADSAAESGASSQSESFGDYGFGGGYSAASAQSRQESRGGYQQQSSFSTARYQSPADDNETTIISKNTVVDGNIRSFANMSIDGNIKGNVETTKDIDLNGKIVGNVACNNAKMRTSQIQGNMQMKGSAYMERDTLLIGDLTSTYANVNGKIKGNLDITGKAELNSDAVVFGDISASTITVSDGAIIQGYVSTTFLNKEESKNIFPEAITIGE